VTLRLTTGRRSGRRALLALLLVALVTASIGFAAASARARSAQRSGASTARTTVGAFHSDALDDQLHVLVRLPAGYGTGTRRYPVIYFLHGLPAGPSSYENLAWVGQALDRAGGKAILVIPQGTRKVNGDPEYLDWGPGHNWATALADELPAYIDTHFRTIASRDGRALVGASAGGYGASNLGLHHPQTFSVVESWSGYFEPTDPSGETALDLGSPAANAAATVHALANALMAQFRRYPTFLAFYVGRQDTRFAQDNRQLNAELTRVGVPHVFALYPGVHSTALWKPHAYTWLAMALRHLDPARAD
jgi:enterochelin esterase-like enzyme